MKKLFTLLLLSPCFYSEAQITFQKTYSGTGDDRGYSVQQTADGGYIITGSTFSFGAGNHDVYLIKTDVNGDSLWTKTFGGLNDDEGRSIQQTSDGGYIIAGSTESFGAGDFDIYLIKTDSNGDSLWTKTFGGTNEDLGFSAKQTTDGGYIVTGSYYISAVLFYNVILIKTDANGNILWTKSFGGTEDEVGKAIQQTSDGGYIITGYTQSFGVGNVDAYLIKTDANGNLLWSKMIGGVLQDWAESGQQTADGGYILAGRTNNFGASFDDIFLVKTDSSGNLLWTKKFGGPGYDEAYSVLQTADGGYMIAGYTTSFGFDDVFLIKTDANGDSLLIKTFGGANSEDGYSIQPTTDGGYIIIGETDALGDVGFYLIKTDSLGNSGCNEVNRILTVTTPAAQISNPSTIVTSLTPTETSPATVISSGSIVSTLCTTVGINEIPANNSFFLFPNPCVDNFIISYERMIMRGNIEILNTLGENVFTQNIFNESKKEINLKNIARGIYFVKVFDGEKYYCKKIIIEKD